MQYPNRVIKKGEADRVIVKAIQNKLNDMGCGPVEVDGVFGNKSVSAVKQFQATRKDSQGNPLLADGQIGAITWEALFGTPEVTKTTATSSLFRGKLVEVAITQIGKMESPLGSNSGDDVDAYLSSVGLPPHNFWCAAFIYWCAKKVSADLSITNPLYKTGGCLAHWNNTKGVKITKINAVNNPSLIKVGSIFIMDHGGGMGHTGIVERIDGGFIHTIEGNSNPAGSSNGIGVFRLVRRINSIQKGFIIYN